MSRPDPVSEYEAWCRKVEGLLNFRSQGALEGRLSLDPQAREATDKLKELLPTLAGLDASKFDAFLKEFETLAESSGKAMYVKSASLLADVARQLLALRRKVTEAIETAQFRKRLEFESKMAGAETSVAKAGALPGADTEGSEVRSALDKADKARIAAQALGLEAIREHRAADMEAALRKLAEVGRALEFAETASVSAVEAVKADQGAMKNWVAMKAQAESALRELKALPGAEFHLQTLQYDYDAAAALIQFDGVMWSGHHAAVKRLFTWPQALADGKLAAAEHAKAAMPAEAMAALTRVRTALFMLSTLAPDHVYKGLDKQAELLAHASSSAKAREASLASLQLAVEGEIRRRREEQAAFEARQREFLESLAELDTRRAPPGAYASAEQSGAAALERVAAMRDWAGPDFELLKMAHERLKTVLAEFAADGMAWEKRREFVDALLLKSTALAKIPAVGAEAMFLRDAALLARKALNQGLRAGIEACDEIRVDSRTLPVALADLEALAKRKEVPLDDSLKLADVELALREHRHQVKTAAREAEESIVRDLQGDAAMTAMNVEARLALQQELLADLGLAQKDWIQATVAAGGSVRALADGARDAKEAIRRVRARLAEALATPGPKRSARASVLAGGAKVPVDPAELKRRKLLADVELLYSPAALQTNKVHESVKRRLNRAGEDLRQILALGDVELLPLAEQMEIRLKQTIADEVRQAGHYKTNQQRLEALEPRVGALAAKLPETHRRLQQRLVDENLAVKDSSAPDMEARVDALAAEIADAEAYAARHAKALEDYHKQGRPVAEALLLVSGNSEKWGGEAKAFDAFCKARLAEASVLSAREGGIPEALAILKRLEAELHGIINAPNPGAELQTLNAREIKSRRRVEYLAAQYEAESASLREGAIAQARAATAEADSAERETAEGLERTVKVADRIVQPYLAMSTLLEWGAATAPDEAKVKADFARARAILADVERTAQRLADKTGSANVRKPVSGGLQVLASDWSTQVQGFAGTIRQLAGQVRSAASEDPPPLKGNAEKAARLIESQAALFNGAAFQASFQVLTFPGGDAKALLAAREKALQVVRQCRADLQHPLLVRLCKAEFNPFDAGAVSKAASGIATVLKEIELQALASA